MAQSYYNMEEAAKFLRTDEDGIKRLVQDRKLHGYRDGADWKFKAEDVEKFRPSQGEDEGDVLLSEVELGESHPGASGSVIGMDGGGAGAADSDLQLADSDINLGAEFAPGAGSGLVDVDSKVSQFEELDLTLEEDLTLEDSQISSGPAGGDSTVDLTGKELDDDDLVLGGSGTGSDITIGGDSGISLVDPADSGLSLEEPLDLSGSGTESLELGEDDMISLGEDADGDSPTELRADDDFLLTPLEEAGDEEGSESGSQVIALDTEGDEAATMIAGDGGVAAMLDEDLGAEAGMDMGGMPAGFGDPSAAGAPLTAAGPALPEMPYSIWNVLSLALCAIVLIFCGMFMYDLMRNMWSWDNTYEVNSSMMDTIIGWIEGK